MTTPAEVLRALFAHHLWATGELIDHLANLPSSRLDEGVPGTYGSMIDTLTHLMDADSRYLHRTKDPSPAQPSAPHREGISLDTLRQELPEHRRRWDEVLDQLERGELSASILGRSDYPDTHQAEGMILLQAIHHGNDHRTQICSTLGAMGEEVPDLDGWEFWLSGRTG